MSGVGGAAGIGLVFVSPDPLSEADVASLDRFAKEMTFEVVLSPTTAANAVLDTIGNGKNLKAFYDSYPADITPIDDDRPFFFQMLRLSSVFSPATWEPGDINWKNAKAVFVLLSLLAVVLVATALCVIVPLWKTREDAPARVAPTLGYFGAIGFGFMFIEMAQMQRLTIFLGHPTYALSVVLFTLLISSGTGSWLIGRLGPRITPRHETTILAGLTAVVLAVGLATPMVTKACAGASTPGRVLVAVALLAVLGFPMGMPFPLGMRRAEARGEQGSLAWLWGINGATSVCSSVLAIIIGLAFGITATFFAGVLSYAAAAAIHAVLARTETPAPALSSAEAREA